MTQRLNRYSGFTNAGFLARLPVTFDKGVGLASLEGATLTLRAKTAAGAVVSGTATTEAPFLEVIARFASGAFSPGIVTAQLRAAVGGQSAILAAFEIDFAEGF